MFGHILLCGSPDWLSSEPNAIYLLVGEFRRRSRAFTDYVCLKVDNITETGYLKLKLWAYSAKFRLGLDTYEQILR